MTASSTVDHGITINTSTEQPPRFEALCLCGFASTLVKDRRGAVQAGRHHLEAEAGAAPRDGISTGDPIAKGVHDSHTPGVSPVGDTGGVSTIVDTTSAGGLEWDDEARSVVVRRLPGMSAKQWTMIRDGMAAFLTAEGFLPEVPR